MKNKGTTILVFTLLIIAAALYRVWDNRPWGFAPQIAMALFAGSVIKDKKFSFLVPLLSMVISDALYQFLYMQGLTEIKGFYHGQWVNYLLFTAITVIGFFIKKNNIISIVGGSLAGIVFFFIASNFLDWIGGGLDINNQPYPKTFDGLMKCFAAGLPFLKGSVWATLFFNGIFFGCYYLYNRYVVKMQTV
jgi:branched-subunit amino acid transport protein AzlD